MDENITISGTVFEIIYQNSENGYTVCEIDSPSDGLFTATGYMPYLCVNENISVTGTWTVHPDYGEQLRVTYYETIMPSDEQSIIDYLSSGAVYGIREATAKKMKEFRLVIWGMHGIYGAGKTMDETFGLIETVEKAAQIYMLTAHLPRVNTIRDTEMQSLAEYFGVDYRKDFLNL